MTVLAPWWCRRVCRSWLSDDCDSAMGMRSGALPDLAITASSSYDKAQVGPENARWDTSVCETSVFCVDFHCCTPITIRLVAYQTYLSHLIFAITCLVYVMRLYVVFLFYCLFFQYTYVYKYTCIFNVLWCGVSSSTNYA